MVFAKRVALDSMASRMRRDRTQPGAILVLGLPVLALDVLALHVLGLRMLDLLAFLALMAVWTLAGSLFLHRQRHAFPDRFTFYALSAVLGMAIAMSAWFVGFQSSLLEGLGNPDPRSVALGVTALLLAPALAGAVLAARDRGGPPAMAQPGAITVLWVVGSCVACLSAFGVENNEFGKAGTIRARIADGRPVMEQNFLPNWGRLADRAAHVVSYTRDIDAHGLPVETSFTGGRGRIVHSTLGTGSGVPVTLLGALYPSGPHSRSRAMAFSKILSLAWLFLVPLWIFCIARDVLDAPVAASCLAGVGALTYAGLNLHAFVAPVSSYWICVASGSLFHNVTQQASLAVGFAGLYLALLDMRHPRGLFALGCLLVSLSALYKPSLFSVAAPAIGLVSLLQGRVAWRRDVLLGWVALVLLPAFWLIYPRLTGTEPLSAPVSVDFLGVLQVRTRGVLPWSTTTELKLLLTIALLAYAPLILPIAGWAARVLRERSTPMPAGSRRSNRPEIAALLVVIALGLFGGYALVESGPRRPHANFLWGAAVAHLCMLPFVTRAIARIEPRWLRVSGWLVYAANLASGVWNLWVYAFFEKYM